MKSISAKLFLALLGLTSLMLVVTLLLARWSFDQGFSDYVNSQQQRRLIRMAGDLSEYYIDNDYRWADGTEEAYLAAYEKWYPRPRRGRRPPHERHEFSRPPEGEGGRPDGRAPPRQPMPIAFYNLKGEPLGGMPELLDGMSVLRVDVIAADKKVAELRTISRANLNSSYESELAKQQTRVSVVIAVLCLFIAGLASWFLSRMLLAPTVRMRKTIGHLARGDYRHRIEVTSTDELGILMKDINRLAETLEKNQQTRKQWLADISHELRTPVAILSGEIDAIVDGIRPLNMNYVKSLNHEVGRLKHLIDDLYQLSLSDIGGMRYELTMLDIAEHLTSVISQNQIRIEEAGLSLKYDTEPDIFIEGDSSRLEQLFTNLINNSINYTNAPGQLIIGISKIEDQAIITFNDSSPGVQAQRLESLFEPLFRGDESRNRQVGGAGLGLTICRNIVLAHEGTINVRNSSYGGLEFVISLPLFKKT